MPMLGLPALSALTSPLLRQPVSLVSRTGSVLRTLGLWSDRLVARLVHQHPSEPGSSTRCALGPAGAALLALQ
jgi:hypothetical protein